MTCHLGDTRGGRCTGPSGYDQRRGHGERLQAPFAHGTFVPLVGPGVVHQAQVHDGEVIDRQAAKVILDPLAELGRPARIARIQ